MWVEAQMLNTSTASMPPKTLHVICKKIDMPRILIVDDDLDYLTVVKSLLQKRGYEVACFSIWNEALDSIKIKEPQIIVLDIFMADLDGLEVCKKLKTSIYTRHIPIIISSGYPYLRQSALDEFGANGFISKPFEVVELMQKIHGILSKKHEMGL